MLLFVSTTKSVYQRIIYESVSVEKSFAEDLEVNEAVKVYAKLPSWFKIPTPLGSYNPDWAILIEDNDQKKLYFVVETKSSNYLDDLRIIEKAKIDCGHKHFKALGEDARYMVANSYDNFINQAFEQYEKT